MELFYQKNLKNDWVLIGQMKPKIVKIKQKTDGETSKKKSTQIETINIFIKKLVEIGSELVR